MKNIFFWIVLIFGLASCENQNSIEVIDFNPISNYSEISDTLELNMDLSNAILKGITLPSDSAKDKFFSIKFKIKNSANNPKKFYYKVYYQNESYKFDELVSSSGANYYNPKASGNFYGSWLGKNVEFHETKIIPNDNNFHEIIDSIRIVGNPRNEEAFYGPTNQYKPILDSDIEPVIQSIQNTPEWMNKIIEKAKLNNIPVSEQLILDAKWMVLNDRQKDKTNLRWRRNPRTGVYGFLLVISDEKDLSGIPYYIKDITLKDSLTNNYKNPYYYYLYDLPSDFENTVVIESKNYLKTKARIEPDNGIYVNPSRFIESIDESNFNERVGMSETYYNYAHFEQFIHYINYDYELNNIPFSYDVIGDDYTQDQYHADSIKYSKSGLLKDHVKITENPGTTVGFDNERNALFVKNPGNFDNNEFRKENVGLKTRIGFTYGKIRAKIHFPEMISDDYVWNGLTCAFWLINQGSGDWNQRSICETGYISKSITAESDSDRVKTNTYSEIDIEIVKTSKYWTKSSYGMRKDYPREDALNDNVIITTTNWDLSCRDPENFNVGVRKLEFENDEYHAHRWHKWYKALTTKYEYPQSKTLGKVLYYEIDWQPDRIIWRIGEDKDNMKVIGYMDDSYTKIPDNQMVAVMTQEFHYALWWPVAPFNQDFVPFPKNDIMGYIYEVEIE